MAGHESPPGRLVPQHAGGALGRERQRDNAPVLPRGLRDGRTAGRYGFLQDRVGILLDDSRPRVST